MCRGENFCFFLFMLFVFAHFRPEDAPNVHGTSSTRKLDSLVKPSSEHFDVERLQNYKRQYKSLPVIGFATGIKHVLW